MKNQIHYPGNNFDKMFVSNRLSAPKKGLIIVLKDGENIVKNDFTIDYILSHFSDQNKEKYYKKLEQADKEGYSGTYMTDLIIRNYIIEEQRKPLVVFTKTFTHENWDTENINGVAVPEVNIYSLMLSATNNGYLNVRTRITVSPEKEKFKDSCVSEITDCPFYFDARKKYKSETPDKSLDFIIRYNFDDLLLSSTETSKLKKSIDKIEGSNALLECMHVPKLFIEHESNGFSNNPLTEHEIKQLNIMYNFAYREIVHKHRYSTDEIRAYLILKKHQRNNFTDECKILGIKEVLEINFNIPKNINFSKYLEISDL